MRTWVLGVMGHVNHGKTALVRALTGQETDRLAEEQRRGISITLGFAHLELASGVYLDLIDMPGHEAFVRTLIAGATGIDAMLLVVAANAGIQPQTVEHVHIAALLGLNRAVVVVSKSDLVGAAEVARVVGDAMSLLARCGIEVAGIVATSAVASVGIPQLRETLSALAHSQPPRRIDGDAYLPIDRAFKIVGHGPVVTGTLRGAPIETGDTLDLFPVAKPVRVRAIQVHGRQVGRALPGQRVALNLRNVKAGDLARGMALCAPRSLTAASWITTSLRTLDEPLQNSVRLRMLFGTSEVDVRLRLLDRDILNPGETAPAQLHCAEPIALPVGEHVVLRATSPVRTVAGGQVLSSGSRCLKRHCPSILESLSKPRPSLAPTEPRSTVSRSNVSGSLRVKTPRMPADLERTKAEMRLASEIAERLRQGSLTPPDPAEIVSSPQTHRAVQNLFKSGLVVRCVDATKDREIWFHSEAVADARRRLAPLLQQERGLLVSEIGTVLGISRKYSLPLLDHLDRVQFTRRSGDRRFSGAKAYATSQTPV